MTESDLTLQDLLHGNYLLQNLDHRTAVFVPVQAKTIEDSPFLDQRLAVPADHPQIQVPVNLLLKLKDPGRAGPSRYLLHTSHVGSTLVSRALGLADNTLSLREPLPIRFLAKQRALIEDQRFESDSSLSAQAFHLLQRVTLSILNRQIEQCDRVLVKCTSWANQAADSFLAHAPGKAHVVAISAELPAFTANMLKSNGAKQDLMAGAAERLRRLTRLLPGFRQSFHEQKPGHIAAAAWLVELLSMQRAAQHTGASLLWLNFDGYLADPVVSTQRLAHHLDLSWGEQNSDRLLANGLLTRYAKTADEKPFDAKQRNKVISDFQQGHPNVMRQANDWLQWIRRDYPQAFSGLPEWANRV